MELSELTQHMHDFVRAKGWYEPDSPRPQTPRNIATSICIESAEVLEHFQWNGAVRDPAALAGELADVALYLLQLASVTGIDLEQAILDKLEVNYGRTWDDARADVAGAADDARADIAGAADDARADAARDNSAGLPTEDEP